MNQHRNMYTLEIKNRAEQLYASGSTYAEITRELGVPKSTLSSWFGKSVGEKFSSAAWHSHLRTIREKAARVRIIAREEREQMALSAARVTVGTLPTSSPAFILSLLAMLYWSEGSRHERVAGVRFTNTDPNMIRLFVHLYKEIYPVDTHDIKAQVQCNPHQDTQVIRKFWAELLDTPPDCITIYIMKSRGKHVRYRKNFAGICQLRLPNVARRREIMAVAHQIELWYKNNA